MAHTTIEKAAQVLHVTPELLAEKSDTMIATELAQEYGRRAAGMGSSDYNIQCERSYIRLDGEKGLRLTWLEFVKYCRMAVRDRAAVQVRQTISVNRLADIEARIHIHMQAAYNGLLEVGRCLIEAKDSGLIPHGQWEEWVRRNTNMTEHRAQRLMKAAREVQPNSRLAELPISKIQEILALPEGEREAMAERAQSEDMTVKQLREAIANERKRSDQMIDKYNAVSSVSRRKDAEIKRLNDRMAERERNYDDWKINVEREHKRELGALRLQLQEALAAPAKMSPEAKARIETLERELSEAEAMAERQAELRQQAQDALLEAQSAAARGAAQVDMTSEAVIASVRTFIGAVGYLPHSTRVATLSPDDRQAVASHVAMVAKWAESMRETLAAGDVYVIEEA